MSRDFTGCRVTILGLGVLTGGASSARYFADRGADVTVTDLLPADTLRTSIDALSQWPVRYVLGEHREEDITRADLVVVGPAVRDDSPFLRLALERGIPLTTEINLVFENCKRPIIGITGSNGKTTTTRLIGALFRAVHSATLEGGNLGRSVLNDIDDQESASPVVLELSSFQLHRLAWIRRSPRVAVVTNMSPNHLDWHGTFDAYEQAKQHIVHYQSPGDQVVLNADDERLQGWTPLCRGRVAWFSMKGPVETGCFLRDGQVVYRAAEGERGATGNGRGGIRKRFGRRTGSVPIGQSQAAGAAQPGQPARGRDGRVPWRDPDAGHPVNGRGVPRSGASIGRGGRSRWHRLLQRFSLHHAGFDSYRAPGL